MMLSSSIKVVSLWLMFRVRVMVHYVLFNSYPDHPPGHLHVFAHKNNSWPLGISLPILHCHLTINTGPFANKITEDVTFFIARPWTFAKEYCMEPLGIQGSERNQIPGSLDSRIPGFHESQKSAISFPKGVNCNFPC